MSQLNATITKQIMNDCIVLLGPPGSGKSIQGAILAKTLSASFFSTGDLLRASVNQKGLFAQEIELILAQGGTVPTNLLLPIIREAIVGVPNNQLLIFDFAGTLEQCVQIEKMLMQCSYIIRAILLIELSLAELHTRLLNRKRSDDRPDLIRSRISDYGRIIAPILSYYAKRKMLYMIDGNGTREEVHKRLLAQIQDILGITSGST